MGDNKFIKKCFSAEVMRHVDRQSLPVPPLQPPPSQPLLIQPVRNLDDEENDLVKEFQQKGCGCVAECSKKYSISDLLTFRGDCRELTRTELDLVIMGQLTACMRVDNSVGRTHKHKETSRVRGHISYTHQGWNICASTFRFLHTVGKTRITTN